MGLQRGAVGLKRSDGRLLEKKSALFHEVVQPCGVFPDADSIELDTSAGADSSVSNPRCCCEEYICVLNLRIMVTFGQVRLSSAPAQRAAINGRNDTAGMEKHLPPWKNPAVKSIIFKHFLVRKNFIGADMRSARTGPARIKV